MASRAIRSFVQLVGALVCLALVVPAESAYAGGAQAEAWQTIVSEHFRVHFHTGTSELAPEIVQMCEAAHEQLTPIFGFVPRQRTDIVLIDETDSANGSAGVFPHNVITLLAVPPSSDDTRNDSENWMWELILHEYAHILHIGQVRGVPRVINIPFGRQLMPNQYLPRWFLEGVATWIESISTSGGRVRNNIYDMYLRAAFLEGTVPTLGQLSASPPEFPYATGWYLYGSSIISYLTESRGQEPLFEAFTDYSDRLLPFALNWLLLKHYGITADDIFAEWLAFESAKALAESTAIRLRGVTELTAVTNTGYFSRRSSFEPNTETLIYIEDGPDDDPIVYINGQRSDIRLTASQAFDIAPDGQSIIIGQRWSIRGRYSYDELYEIDLNTGRKTRLTRASRAREPSVSPDGRYVVYVAPLVGRTVLVELDREQQTERILLDPGPWALVAQPQWSPDGQFIYFSWQQGDEGRHIVRLDRHRETWTHLTRGRVIDDYPEVTPDGRWLYFSSDRGETYNIHAIDLTSGERFRITNVVNGVFAPTVIDDSDGCRLMVASYSADGYDLAEMPLETDCSPLRRDEPGPEAVRPPGTLPISTSFEASTPRRYHTGLLAHPRTWSPRYIGIFGIDRTGLVGLETNGTDPAQRFAWNLLLDVGTKDGQPRWSMYMSFRQLYPTIDIRSSRFIERRECDVFIDEECRPFTRARYTVGVSASFPFRSYRASHNFNAGYDISRSRPFSDPERGYQLDPIQLPPRFLSDSRADTISLSYSGSTSRGYVQSISAERGWQWSFSGQFRHPAWGADQTEAVLRSTVRNYQPLGQRLRHVLAWQLTGGASLSRRSDPSDFTAGGFEESGIYDVITEEIYLPGSTIRGYDPSIRRGDYFYRANIEYRFPIVRFDYGYSTLPFFFERLHGAVYLDAGNALSALDEWANTLVSVGAELSLDVRAGYIEGRRIRAGIARGLTDDGRWQLYIGFGGTF